MNFWGRRSEAYIPTERVVTLGDSPQRAMDVYVKLQQYDSKDFYYYSLKYGIIRDKELFEHVLGKII